MPSQVFYASKGPRGLIPTGLWISLSIQFPAPADVAAYVDVSVLYVCTTHPVLESEMGSGIEYASRTHGSEPMATFTGVLWSRQRGCQADTAECLAYYYLFLPISSWLLLTLPLGFKFVATLHFKSYLCSQFNKMILKYHHCTSHYHHSFVSVAV